MCNPGWNQHLLFQLCASLYKINQRKGGGRCPSLRCPCHHISPKAVRCLSHQLCDRFVSTAPDPNDLHSRSEAQVKTWILQPLAFPVEGVCEDLSNANGQAEEFDFLKMQQSATHVWFTEQRRRALYSTYCQCIIQQFTVSGCSLNGTERSVAHGAPLASQPRTECVHVCERERETSATVKCKHFSGFPLRDLLHLFRIYWGIIRFPICANKHKNTACKKYSLVYANKTKGLNPQQQTPEAGGLDTMNNILTIWVTFVRIFLGRH